MELKDINKLIDKVTEKGITDFEMEHEDFRIRICKKAPDVIKTETIQVANPQPVAAAPAVPQASPVEEPAVPEEDVVDSFHIISSPMVGTFYGAPSPGAKAYVSVGDRVKKGQVLCIVEAMKIMNEIQSDADGVVRKIYAQNEQPVEFGERLFSVETD